MVTLLDAVLGHIRDSDAVRVATLFGSQARRMLGAAHQADKWSDIDLQVLAPRPADFATFEWVRSVPGHRANVCAQRPVFGGVFKQTILYDAGELDLVILPYRRMRLGRCLFRLGLHERIGVVRRGLTNFADIMRFEHVVVKGGQGWETFYRDVSRSMPRLGLTNEEARAAADVAYVDAVCVLGRIDRGELVSAQRILHQSVVETNIRLLYESRERRGLQAYHRARRAEAILPAEELSWIRADVPLQPDALAACTRGLIDGTRKLTAMLTGETPDWPPL